MNQQEARKLIDLVNYEVKYNPNHREWILEETWCPDHSGKLPVYIVDVLTSEGLVIDRHDIIQVKMSRTYYSDKPDADYPYYLWFNRFPVPKNADWIVLVGIYAKRPDDAENAKAKSTSWDTIMLAFTNKEMTAFSASIINFNFKNELDKYILKYYTFI